MDQRDRFVGTDAPRQAGPAKEALAADPALLGELEGLLAKAAKARASYGPRIEALRRGCEAGGLPIPGGAAAGSAPPAAP